LPDVVSRHDLENIARIRADQAAKECEEHFDGLTVTVEVNDDRGIVTVLQDDRYIVSKEFVESDESLDRLRHLGEYVGILLGKARLVVIAPMERAVDLRLRMLELNNHWLFYYQLYYYDDGGRLHLLDRAEWRRLRGLPKEEEWRPEVA
jgi:hypothetical protein